MSDLVYSIITVLCFVPAIVLHEMGHGFAAYKLGDPTAARAGRLSFNPLRHIDLFGTVLLPLMLLVADMPVFGYAKPVPYNPRYFKDKRTGELVVGLAGPAANLVQALAAAAVAWVLYLAAPVARLVSGSVVFAYFYLLFLPMFALINLYLMFFNLIPVPPLDGSCIIGFLVPERHLPTYYKVERYAMPVFLVVAVVVPYATGVNVFGVYLNATAGNLINLLFPFAVV